MTPKKNSTFVNRSIVTPWGPIGYVTFKRTYARRLNDDDPNSPTEEFPDVVERELDACERQLKLEFTDEEKRRYAETRLGLKWSVAGRFMWQLGTKTVERLGLPSLQNCFSADTEFVTSQGIKKFADFNDGDTVVIKGADSWKGATVKQFGEQDLVELRVLRGMKGSSTIRTTPNHRWIVCDKYGRGNKIKLTSELQAGDYLKKTSTKTNMHNLKMCKVGIQHGLVFGDGHYNKNAKCCAFVPCGDAREEYIKLFHETEVATEISGLPYNWKELPSFDYNKHYIYGFMAGWFAADGSVSKNGGLILCNKSRETLMYAKGLLAKLDIYCGDPILNREISPFDGSPSTLYKLTIFRENVNSDFLLLAKHKKNWKEYSRRLNWRVESVGPVVSREKVWCVVEPENEEFALSNGILTKNCANITVDHPVEPFTWAFDMLMLGAGVGFNVQREHVYSLPKLKGKIKIERLDTNDADFIVPDTREGWVKLLSKVLKAHFYGGQGFTYSTVCIRGKGAPIKGFGGTASGPEELCVGIGEIHKILNARSKKKLRPIDCLDIMNIIGSIVVAGNVRRCLPEDSLVFCEDGLRKIAEVKVGHRVHTTSGLQKVTNVFNQGTQKVFKIITNAGDYYATAEHRFAVLDEDCKKKWKKVSELAEGDRLVGFADKVVGKKTSLPDDFTANRPVNSTTCEPITIPELDADVAWLIGLVHGDGYIYNRASKRYGASGQEKGSSVISIAFHEDDTASMAKADKIMQRFTKSHRLIKKKDERCWVLRAHSQRLVEYFARYIKQPTVPLRIPDFVLEGSPDIRMGYLCGLFDSDGSAKTRPVNLVTTVYEDFSREVQSLYSSLGITTRRRTNIAKDKGWKPKFQVQLISQQARFIDEVLRFSTKSVGHKKKKQHGFTVSGNSVKKQLKYKDYGHVWDGKGDMNYETFISIGGKSDGLPITVKSVTPDFKEVQTFDIEVENDHEFFVDGILSHNSAQLAIGDFDDLEYLKAKRWDLGNVPNWRAMSNNSVAIPKNMKDLPNEFWQTYEQGEPYGLINLDLSRSCGRLGDTRYKDENVAGYNPCQPSFAPIIGIDGEKEFSEISAGSKIWSRQGWTTVLRKWSNGIKPVYKYTTTDGAYFIGTEQHRVETPSGKVEIQDAKEVRICPVISIGDRAEYENIVSVEFLGDFEVFDITVDNDSHTYWSGDISVSNCAEQSLESAEQCCLSEIFLPNVSNYDEFIEVVSYAYRVCKHSLRLPCHLKQTEAVVHKNMRMGIGVTGIMECSEEQLSWLPKAYEWLRSYDEEYSKKNGWPTSIKLTTLKPSGTLSLLKGVTPGVHPSPAGPYYIRRVRIASNSPLIPVLQRHGVHVEPQYGFDGTPDKGTFVASFPCKVGESVPVAANMHWKDQLEMVKRLQTDWSDNSVSCTVYYKKEDLPELRKYIEDNMPSSFKTLSFLLYSGHGFKQAPYETITKEAYDEMMKTFIPITSIEDGKGDDFKIDECAGGSCPIK